MSTGVLTLALAYPQAGLVLHRQLLQMLHERLQGRVISVHELTALLAILWPVGVMCGGGVDLVQQDTGLAAALVAIRQPRDWEAVFDDVGCVGLGGLQELAEVLVLGLVLILGLAPRCNGLAVMNAHLEEAIQQEDHVRLYALGVQEHGLGGSLHGVAMQRGLDHQHTVAAGLAVQHDAEVGRLIGAAVEDLQKHYMNEGGGPQHPCAVPAQPSKPNYRICGHGQSHE